MTQLTQCPEIQFAQAKAEGIVYELIDDKPYHQLWMLL